MNYVTPAILAVAISLASLPTRVAKTIQTLRISERLLCRVAWEDWVL